MLGVVFNRYWYRDLHALTVTRGYMGLFETLYTIFEECCLKKVPGPLPVATVLETQTLRRPVVARLARLWYASTWSECYGIHFTKSLHYISSLDSTLVNSVTAHCIQVRAAYLKGHENYLISVMCHVDCQTLFSCECCMILLVTLLSRTEINNRAHHVATQSLRICCPTMLSVSAFALAVGITSNHFILHGFVA